MYDDIWTGGKCMYKLEPVVADGGKLIIYAPHIDEISYTHGKILDEIGYHTRDYFVAQWDKFKDYPWGVVAHSTHVKGIGTYENGVEKPRVEVILATGIPEERCRRVNLGVHGPGQHSRGRLRRTKKTRASSTSPRPERCSTGSGSRDSTSLLSTFNFRLSTRRNRMAKADIG